MVFPLGSVINALAILVGGALGLMLHGRLPEKMRQVVFQGLGLCVLVIGMQMALQGKNGLLVVLSILIGGIVGEALKLEDRFAGLADRLKGLVRSNNVKFVDGMVNASLIYCIGAMAILGSLTRASVATTPFFSPKPCWTVSPPSPWLRPTAQACFSPPCRCCCTRGS
jgi:uncharacterized membrane protein YqgA involved in biofilm formation